MTIQGLVAVLLIGVGLYLAARIIRMPPQRPGVGRDSNVAEQPDGAGGIVAVVLCAAFLAFLVIITVRSGAWSGGTVFLAGTAVSGIGWGLKQIRLARAQDKREAEVAKGNPR
jgi:hypothetical protein